MTKIQKGFESEVALQREENARLTQQIIEPTHSIELKQRAKAAEALAQGLQIRVEAGEMKKGQDVNMYQNNLALMQSCVRDWTRIEELEDGCSTLAGQNEQYRENWENTARENGWLKLEVERKSDENEGLTLEVRRLSNWWEQAKTEKDKLMQEWMTATSENEGLKRQLESSQQISPIGSARGFDKSPSEGEVIYSFFEEAPAQLSISSIHTVDTKPQTASVVLIMSTVSFIHSVASKPPLLAAPLALSCIQSTLADSGYASTSGSIASKASDSPAPPHALPAPFALSQIQSLCTAPQLDRTRFEGNVVVNLTAESHKQWKFMQRIQSAISRGSGLDLSGPEYLMRDFLVAMKEAHAEYDDSRKAASDAKKELKKLRQRGTCNDRSHTNTADTLEAQGMKLAMEHELLVQAQTQSAQAHAGTGQAVKSLHGKLKAGTCLCEPAQQHVGRRTSL